MMPDNVSTIPWIASDITAIELETAPIIILTIASNRLTKMAVMPARKTSSL